MSDTTPRSNKAEAFPKLSDFPVTLDVGLRWGDMDAMGHVNNSRFFTYFESARIAYFDRLGIRHGPKGTKVGVILASTRCDFLKPLAHPETAVVGARMKEVRTTSLTMDHAVFRGKDREVCAVGSAVLVLFDYAKDMKMEVPDDLRAAINELESGRAVNR